MHEGKRSRENDEEVDGRGEETETVREWRKEERKEGRKAE